MDLPSSKRLGQHTIVETMEQHKIQLVLPNQQAIGGSIQYEEDADECQLQLTFQTISLTATASDYFEAFCVIRKQLEARGITPWCFGASRKVYPSGMVRDMSLGLKAYKLAVGQPARTQDLVSIFDSDADVEAVTVAAQHAYFEAWLVSLKQP